MSTKPYIRTAQRYTNAANELATMLFSLPEEQQERGLELIARLVNAGVVSCPRGVQGTVRLNIISTITKDLPIRCTLIEKPVDPEDPTGRTYKALTVTHIKNKKG